MHTILLPYYCEAEVDRFERILAHIAQLGAPKCEFEFVLASSPRIEPSERLLRAARKLAPARLLECPTQTFGYPDGPSAMFWDCMHYVDRAASHHAGSEGGFALWLESDMCPVKAEWLDRLDTHWRASGDVVVMGNVIPELYREKRRRFRLRHLFKHRELLWTQWVPFHVNGGACYRRDLVRHISAEHHRTGVFDVDIGGMLWNRGGFSNSPAFAFSTMRRLHRDLRDPNKVLLHGYLQDKDQFINVCTAAALSNDILPHPRVASERTEHQNEAAVGEPLLDAILAMKDREPAELRVYESLESQTRISHSIPHFRLMPEDGQGSSWRRAA